MNLDEAPESSNVQDSRGMGLKIAAGGAGGVVLLILGLIFGPQNTALLRRVSTHVDQGFVDKADSVLRRNAQT